jgi:hypothetical protein
MHSRCRYHHCHAGHRRCSRGAGHLLDRTEGRRRRWQAERWLGPLMSASADVASSNLAAIPAQ